ncbi:hypothetical protein IL38_23720 [Actinopolyspora erythraea]|uniref:Uncharacterized protein n=1 Tax=Actinopolyspora erythraea TaxID=414996 RepID=A0ABR4WY58_9ACTN|nr:hypothetical protein [Actinopolyspora erythraea]KGI79322.1 hypothetical protein IL38_23720 [Actinopolyspora erythraea]
MGRKTAITLASDRNAWEQQPGESERMFARFTVYRDLGEGRTLNQTAEILNSTSRKTVTYRSLTEYASRYRWRERAEAFDVDQAAADRARMAKLRKEAVERHRKQGQAMQGRAAQELAQLAVGSLSPNDILRFFAEGARMELAALREPTERTVTSGAEGSSVEVTEVGEWSPEQRRTRLQALEGELARRLGRSSGGDEDEDDRVTG